MIKTNRKIFLAAVLIWGTISFGACSSASTNTVSTGNTTASSVGSNAANTNKSNAAAPQNANPTAQTNPAVETKPPTRKEDMLSADTTTAGSTGDKVGVPECDEYIAKYEACVTSKAPEAQRESLIISMQEMRKGWQAAASNPQAKAALAGGCKQALTTAKQSMSAYSCNW